MWFFTRLTGGEIGTAGRSVAAALWGPRIYERGTPTCGPPPPRRQPLETQCLLQPHLWMHFGSHVFALLVGAIAHDVGHPGLNNVYLVKSKHPLALVHNDISPLENMHCATVYEVLSKPQNNIFSNLSDSQWREARKIIIDVILGTDMSHHFEQISKTQLFLDVHFEDTRSFCSGEKDTISCFEDESNRMPQSLIDEYGHELEVIF